MKKITFIILLNFNILALGSSTPDQDKKLETVIFFAIKEAVDKELNIPRHYELNEKIFGPITTQRVRTIAYKNQQKILILKRKNIWIEDFSFEAEDKKLSITAFTWLFYLKVMKDEEAMKDKTK